MPKVKNRFYDGLLSLWQKNKNQIYVLTTYNLYGYTKNTNGERKELDPREDYFIGGCLRVKGKSANDILTCGYNTYIWHFNYYSWDEFDEIVNEDQYVSGLDYKGNVLVAVSKKYINLFHSKAVIALGKQQN